MVKVRDIAPNFKLLSTKGEVELSKLSSEGVADGKWIVLFFYSGDFTSVCSTEVPAFAEVCGLQTAEVEVFGVRADSIYSDEAWISHCSPRLSTHS